MSAFDVQVRKVDNDWVKRVPWQNGTDGALLREVFDIHQKWGMSNLIPAFTAVKHVFGQDAPKAATVEVSLCELALTMEGLRIWAFTRAFNPKPPFFGFISVYIFSI